MVTGVWLISSLFHNHLFEFFYAPAKPLSCPVVQGGLESGLVRAEQVLKARCTQLHLQSYSQHIKKKHYISPDNSSQCLNQLVECSLFYFVRLVLTQ